MIPRNVTCRIGLLVCLASASPWMLGSPVAAEREPSPTLVRPSHTTEGSPGFVRVEVNPTAYESLLTRSRVTLRDFPLPDRAAADLELSANAVLKADARFVVVDASGERVVPGPSFRSFTGTVLGEPSSRVVLNLFGGRIAGFIKTSNEEYAIAPGPFTDDGSVTIRERDADPDRPDRPFCAAEVPHQQGTEPRPGTGGLGAPPIDGSTLLMADVAIDATYEWYEHFPSLEVAQGYILNVMAQVSTIYQDEVNVEIKVPFLRVFTTAADPYTDTTSTSTLLNDLRDEWNANQTGVARTVAHLFSWRPSGGAGVAYLDALCTGTLFPGSSWDYGVSTLSALGSSWEKVLVAHELGHNFSSPHTQCYSPEIDQCANEQGCYQGPIVQSVGTIMSYCNSFTSVFHPRVEDETIRPAAEAAYPTCISAVSNDPPDPPQGLSVN